jgi:hypothetical protein
MPQIVPFYRRSIVGLYFLGVLLFVNRDAQAQGIGFQGGLTIDPEQVFVGTHLETGEIFRNFRIRPAIDGGSGGDYSLATINVEFLYYVTFERSRWSIYQGGGPAVVLLRRNDDTSVHAGTFVTFGFAHENGFFADFKLGGGSSPTLKFGVGYTIGKKTP